MLLAQQYERFCGPDKGALHDKDKGCKNVGEQAVGMERSGMT
jgi:hypothetical protein